MKKISNGVLNRNKRHINKEIFRISQILEVNVNNKESIKWEQNKKQ